MVSTAKLKFLTTSGSNYELEWQLSPSTGFHSGTYCQSCKMTRSESSSSLPSPNIFSSTLKSSNSLSLRSKSSQSALCCRLTSIAGFTERLSFSSMPNDNVDVSESVSDKELCQSSTMFLLIFHDTPERNKWWYRITDHMARVCHGEKTRQREKCD